MAASPLSLHPALRGWYAAGLRHIYFDDEALQGFADARAQNQEDKAQKSKSPQGPQSSTQSLAQGNAQNFTAQRQRRQEEQAQAPTQVPRHTPVQTPSRAPQRPQRSQAATVPVDQWPMPWQERLKATLASSKGAPVLWTYWALGEDLGGSPNVARRDILRRILGELAMPRGTHSFWPLALARQELKEDALELEANVPIFLAGVELLAPRVCVVMGSKALRTILPTCTTGPYQQVEHGRTLFLVLPDMDMLLAESERIPRVVAYLRGALQPFAKHRS